MKPPLELYAEVETASGARLRWDANQDAGSRPKGFLIRSRLGEGFSDAGAQFSRRIDLDYPDFQLVNNVVVAGSDGSVAYEGRISAMPRELSDSHSIGVTLTGHMAHAKDRKFSHVFVDRALSEWGGISRARQASSLVANLIPNDAGQGADPTDNEAAVITSLDGSWVSPYKPFSEAWYDAGPNNLIGSVNYSWAREGTTINPATAQWEWYVGIAADDKGTSSSTTSNLRAAGPSTLQTFTASGRYAYLQMYYNGAPAGADGARYALDWTKLAVYGKSSIPTYTGEVGEPPGVYASDVMRHIISTWCPQLDPSGIRSTSYVIQQLAFKDQTFPYDAFLELNKFHLWNLGVWEGKRVVFEPYDLTDWDWEIRTDDQGTTFAPQGPSIDSLFNGIVVIYNDVLTGVRNVLTPDVYSELSDSSDSNPWNQWRIDHFDEVSLSTPTTAAQALQMGRARLGDTNTPKNPGTISVTGHLKDRAGHWQQGWKVRAGDTIRITNFPNDQPRLVHEATWDGDTKTLTLAVDAPPSTLDAYQDRVSNALAARGLG